MYKLTGITILGKIKTARHTLGKLPSQTDSLLNAKDENHIFFI